MLANVTAPPVAIVASPDISTSSNEVPSATNILLAELVGNFNKAPTVKSAGKVTLPVDSSTTALLAGKVQNTSLVPEPKLTAEVFPSELERIVVLSKLVVVLKVP